VVEMALSLEASTGTSCQLFLTVSKNVDMLFGCACGEVVGDEGNRIQSKGHKDGKVLVKERSSSNTKGGLRSRLV
jgi:hypothetical protein